MHGYKGTILKINLTDKSTELVQIPKDWYEKFIGGEGFAAKIIYDSLKPGIDPLDDENILVLSTGPLTGTRAPCSGRLCIGFKSPLSGTIGMTNIGGFIAPMIKKAGYDSIVITGKSKTPTYVYIKNSEVEFKDAKNLWGLDTEETEKQIRAEVNNDKVRILEIGPAGENLVRYSAIITDAHRAAGRGGSGAVMGSKNLKAIACFGSSKLEIFDDDSLNQYSKKARQELDDEGFVREQLKPFGTPTFADAINATGALPTRNWQRTTYDVMDKIGYKAYHKILKVKPNPCYGCPIACGRHTEILEGEYKGESGGGPEFETVGAFGSKCYVDDLNQIAKANYICNRMGLDTISTGQTIATAMEWYEKNIIDKNDTDGLELEFGNSKAMIKMVEKIALRDGFGDILAEGSYKAAKKIGNNAIKYVMHVKGMEIASCGVRASKGEALSHMISPRGACHLRPFASTIDALGYIEPELGINERPSPLEDSNKAWVKPLMELSMLTNLLGVCLFASITLAVKGKTWTELYNAATGKKTTLEEALKCSERVLNLERLFNAREGFDRKDDTLPERLTKEPAPDGLGKGQVVKIDIMLDEFYEAMDWNLKTGLPTERKLEELDLLELVSTETN